MGVIYYQFEKRLDMGLNIWLFLLLLTSFCLFILYSFMYLEDLSTFQNIVLSALGILLAGLDISWLLIWLDL